MSGAEALVGVGILCNSMQIVTFARDALQIARHINDGGSPDPKLGQYVQDAELEYQRLLNKAAQLSLSDDQQQIIQTGAACNERLKTLSKRLEGLSLKRDVEGIRKFALSVKQGAKTLWSAQELKDYERDFERYDSLLKAELLLRIANQQDAAAIQQADAYQNLDARLKHYVDSHLPGVTETLVKNDGSTTRQHITETEEHTRRMFAQRNIQTQEQDKYDQLLESLRYPGMNARKNTVKDNHPETFKWVFETQIEAGLASNGDVRSSDNSSLSGDEHSLNYDSRTTPMTTNSGRSALVSWLESDSPLFWVSGRAASGKSTLMRYILQSPQTKYHLDQEIHNTLIISHYFWKPENSPQRTIRGMLSALLFQILEKERGFFMCLNQNIEDLALKQSFSEWHLTDIQTGLLACLKASQRPICIFLDGLDEAEDYLILLDQAGSGSSLLDDMQSVKGVKVCISSRNEPELQHYLGHCPRILLQDLTENDMRKLAKARLSKVSTWPAGYRKELISTLLDKAAGVFLWLVLAIESLNRGIRLREPHDTLRNRLDQMPEQLESLIRDMFARQGDDARLYRMSASLLFKIRLVYSDLLDDLCTKFNILRLPLVAMVAKEDFIDACVREGPQYATGSRILKLMEECERNINVHCAGLLEIGPLVDLESELETPLATHGGIFPSFQDTAQLRYIHRSVYDFLTDTTDGCELVKACNVSDDDIRKRSFVAMLALENIPLRHPCLTCINAVDRLPSTGPTSLENALVMIREPLDDETAASDLLSIAWKWHTGWKLRVSRRWCSPLADQYGLSPDKSLLALDFLHALLRSGMYEHASKMVAAMDESQLPVAIYLVFNTWPRCDGIMLVKTLERLHGSSTITEQTRIDALSFLLLQLFLHPVVRTYEARRSKEVLHLIEKMWPVSRNAERYSLSFPHHVVLQNDDKDLFEAEGQQDSMFIALQLGYILRLLREENGDSMLESNEGLPTSTDGLEIAVASLGGHICCWQPGEGYSIEVGEDDHPISTQARRSVEERMQQRLLASRRDLRLFSSSRETKCRFRMPYYRGNPLLEYMYQKGFKIHPWRDRRLRRLRLS